MLNWLKWIIAGRERTAPFDSSEPFATDWDVAEAAMRAQTELQQRGIDYRFLGVTGEEGT